MDGLFTTLQVRSYKMNYTYQVIENLLGEKIILRSDGANIPLDLANSDYQAYLAEQSTPSIPEGGN